MTPNLYSTSDPKFAAHLIKDTILRLNSCTHTAQEIVFSFEDPHASGAMLFEQFVKGEKPETLTRAGMVLVDGFIETTANGRYLIWRNNVADYRQSWPLERAKVSVPPNHILIDERVVLLPDEPLRYGTQQELFQDVVSIIHRYIDVPEAWEKLIAGYVMLSWVFDGFRSVPYLRFLGEYGTGKTRMLEVARELCYRAIMTNGASSTASIFRILDQWRGTLALDEGDFRNSAEWSDIIKILNAGYKANSPVLRAEGKTFNPTPFHVYGPKILSNRDRFQDEALESRCLTFETTSKQMRKDVPLELTPAFFTEARALRNKLLAWRFDTWRVLVAKDTNIDGVELRLNQILSPLYVIAPNDEFRAQLLEFAKQYGLEQRQRRPQVIVLEAMRAILIDRRKMQTEKSVIPLKSIVEKADLICAEMGLARDSEHKELLKPKEVCSLIRSMGLEIKRYGQGRVWVVDEVALAEQCCSFGLE